MQQGCWVVAVPLKLWSATFCSRSTANSKLWPGGHLTGGHPADYVLSCAAASVGNIKTGCCPADYALTFAIGYIVKLRCYPV